MQVDDLDAVVEEPRSATLGIHAVTHDHLTEAKLVDHSAAVPAGSQSCDQDGVVPGGAASSGSKGVGLAMQRSVTLLHQPVMSRTQQCAIEVEDRSAYRNAALSEADASLFQRDR